MKWIDQLLPIINEYSEDSKLNKKEVDSLIRIIKAKINYHFGNIDIAKYNKQLDTALDDYYYVLEKETQLVDTIEECTGYIQIWVYDHNLDCCLNKTIRDSESVRNFISESLSISKIQLIQL